MINEQALVPTFLESKGNTSINNLLSVFVGVFFMALLAQISLPLPWTPVPITGQTFGVALVSMLWGRNRSFYVVASYLLLGCIGLPIFALGKAGFTLGPTLGYLLGMLVGSFFMGSLSDRGWCHKFWSTYLVTVVGSVITFLFGILFLSFYVPSKELLMAGVIPFLPGDLIKSLVASYIVFRANKKIRAYL